MRQGKNVDDAALLQGVEYPIVTQWDRVDKAPEAFPEICPQALAKLTPPMDGGACRHQLAINQLVATDKP